MNKSIFKKFLFFFLLTTLPFFGTIAGKGKSTDDKSPNETAFASGQVEDFHSTSHPESLQGRKRSQNDATAIPAAEINSVSLATTTTTSANISTATDFGVDSSAQQPQESIMSKLHRLLAYQSKLGNEIERLKYPDAVGLDTEKDTSKATCPTLAVAKQLFAEVSAETSQYVSTKPIPFQIVGTMDQLGLLTSRISQQPQIAEQLVAEVGAKLGQLVSTEPPVFQIVGTMDQLDLLMSRFCQQQREAEDSANLSSTRPPHRPAAPMDDEPAL
jgi:hypothetical protein